VSLSQEIVCSARTPQDLLTQRLVYTFYHGKVKLFYLFEQHSVGMTGSALGKIILEEQAGKKGGTDRVFDLQAALDMGQSFRKIIKKMLNILGVLVGLNGKTSSQKADLNQVPSHGAKKYPVPSLPSPGSPKENRNGSGKEGEGRVNRGMVPPVFSLHLYRRMFPPEKKLPRRQGKSWMRP
jgi:hypothetical protein